MTREEIEMELRQEWWLNHGHTGLYGDDGEMQCGVCPADFKRQPLDELRQAVTVARLQRLAVVPVEGQTDKLEISTGTYVRLLGIAHRLDCNLSAALDEVMREFEARP